MEFKKYLKKNFDDLAIVSSLGRLMLAESPGELEESDYTIWAAMERSTNELDNASFAEIKSYLLSYDEDQISGLVSNIKGIYHELEFVNFENEDGDSVFAVMHESTNYPGTDVVLFDTTTGESLEVQLKAVADDQAIDRWVEENPGIAVYATEEVAEDSGVKSSGMKNDELQKDVEDFVDQFRNAEDPLTVVDQLPSLALASVGFAVYLLYRDYNKGLISLGDFKVKAAAVTGIKAAKMGMFVCLLSLPVIGQITGAALIIKLLLSLDLSCFDRSVIRRS